MAPGRRFGRRLGERNLPLHHGRAQGRGEGLGRNECRVHGHLTAARRLCNIWSTVEISLAEAEYERSRSSILAISSSVLTPLTFDSAWLLRSSRVDWYWESAEALLRLVSSQLVDEAA